MLQLELMWFRRKLFWIGLFGFCVAIPVLLSLLIMNVGETDDTAARWFGSMQLSQVITWIVAMIVGSSMGAVEHKFGMSRYVALSGTNRTMHAIKRLFGGLIAWLAAVLVMSGTLYLMMLAFHGWPDGMEYARELWLASLVPGIVYACLGFGLARLVGSQGIAIAVLLGIFVVDGPLNAVPKVGEWWTDVSLLHGFGSLVTYAAGETDTDLLTIPHMLAIIIGWPLVVLAAGLLVDSRRDL